MQFSTGSETVNEGGGTFSIPVTLTGPPATTPVVTTFASGFAGSISVAVNNAGTVFVSNVGAGTVSKVTPAGIVTTFASGIPYPLGLAFNAAGNLFVSSDIGNNSGLVSEVTPAGVVTTFATGFDAPQGLAFDAAGNLYVSNNNNGTVSKVTPAGVVSTFASGFSGPQGLAFDAAGNLYVANGAVISEVTPAGVVSTFATGLSLLQELAFDAAGNLYAANEGANDVVEVTPQGVVTILVSGLSGPYGVAFNAVGNLFIANLVNNTVSKVTEVPDTITVPFTLGGTAVSGTDFSGVTASPLTFSPGQTTATITGTLIDNHEYNPNNRTLTVTLGIPTNATLGSPSVNTLTITPDATVLPPTVVVGSPVQTGGTFSIPITLSAPSEVPTSIPYTLGGSAGFSGVSTNPLIIPAGQTTGFITGTLTNGGETPDSSVSITLGTPTNATLGNPSASNLVEGPTVSFGTPVQTGAGFSIPLTLSGPATVNITIPFTLSGAAGLSGATVGPLVILAGQTTAAITGTFADGGLGGTSQTVIATLGTPTGDAVSGANPVTFTEATRPVVNYGPLVQTGSTFSMVVTLSNPSPFATSIPFTLGGTEGTIGVTASPLVIPAGQTTETITGTLADFGQDPGQNLTFSAGTPTNATIGTGASTNLVEGPTVSFGTPVQTAAGFSIPVTLSAPALQNITIPFTLGGTAGRSGVTASPLVILAGQTTAAITGTFTDGGLGGTSQTVTATLGTPTGDAVSGANPVTFSEATRPTVTFGPPVQHGSTFTIAVTLSGPSPFATTIPFMLGGTAGVSGATPSPLVIPAGQTSGTITGTLANGGDTPGAGVTFTAGTPTNATLGSGSTSNLVEGPTVSYGTPVQTGASFSIPVTLSASATQNISIPFTLTGTAGLSGATISPLVILAGQTTAHHRYIHRRRPGRDHADRHRNPGHAHRRRRLRDQPRDLHRGHPADRQLWAAGTERFDLQHGGDAIQPVAVRHKHPVHVGRHRGHPRRYRQPAGHPGRPDHGDHHRHTGRLRAGPRPGPHLHGRHADQRDHRHRLFDKPRRGPDGEFRHAGADRRRLQHPDNAVGAGIAKHHHPVHVGGNCRPQRCDRQPASHPRRADDGGHHWHVHRRRPRRHQPNRDGHPGYAHRRRRFRHQPGDLLRSNQANRNLWPARAAWLDLHHRGHAVRPISFRHDHSLHARRHRGRHRRHASPLVIPAGQTTGTITGTLANGGDSPAPALPSRQARRLTQRSAAARHRILSKAQR